MEKVLNQREIDQMVRAARTGVSPPPPSMPVVQSWDIRRAGQIGPEQLRAINQLHELFARNLTTSIGGFLRIAFDCSLVSAEHLTYREFLQRIPEKTYFASCELAPFGVQAAMQLDLGTAFPLLDALMGGEGRAGALDRNLTEVEEHVLESVMRIICRDLETGWRAINLQFRFGACQQISQAQRLMPPDEKNLCLSFEIKVSEMRGTLNMAVPALVSNALLRKISADISYQRTRGDAEVRRQIERCLLRCMFPVELSVPHLQVPLASLAALRPGEVLPLPRDVTTAAQLAIEDVPICAAAPVRVGTHRAARVVTVPIQNSSAGES